MGPLIIGFILVALALVSVVAVMYMVVKEEEVHEEHYIPPTPHDAPADPAA